MEDGCRFCFTCLPMALKAMSILSDLTPPVVEPEHPHWNTAYMSRILAKTGHPALSAVANPEVERKLATWNVASSAAAAVSNYLAYEMTRMVLFTLSFAVIMALWKLLSRTLDFAVQIPILSTVNDLGGAAIGLIRGSALMFIACWLLKGLFPPEMIASSVLLQFFCTTNPFTILASFLQGFTASSQL